MQLVVLVFCLVCSVTLAAQEGVKHSTVTVFTINLQQETIRISVLSEPSRKIAVKEELIYHWYKSNSFLSTQGGYDGKIAHGTFTSFYLNNNMKETGCFRYGLKDGRWKSWSPAGKLSVVTSWKKGQRHGRHSEFDPDGKEISRSNYRKGQLHGKAVTLTKGEVSACRIYRNGKEIPAKSSPPSSSKKSRGKSNG